VLYIPDDVAANFAVPVKTVTEPPVVALRSAPLRAITPRGEDLSVAQVVESPPVRVAGLPKTASHMPALALFGLLSMTVGVSLRRKLCGR
jgi:LPXTG-motif cell wall-anchored protein